MDKGKVLEVVLEDSTKLVLPVTVSGLTIFGVALPDIVAVLTITYLVLQIGYTVYKITKGDKDG